MYLRIISGLVLMFLLTSCGGKQVTLDPKVKSDKDLYELGQTYLKDEDYDRAREAFRTVFDNFPKSDYRILAKLAYADSYFNQGAAANFILAIQEYQDFISLFPFSPKACYAQIQIGKCYMNMSEKPDRDQTSTKKALDEFRKVVDNYPDCEQYKEAYQHLLIAYAKLAEHEYLVAKYYQRTGRHGAAIERFRTLFKTYPESVHQAEYVFGLAESLREMGQYSESCALYEKVLEKWPQSEHSADATKFRNTVCAQEKQS